MANRQQVYEQLFSLQLKDTEHWSRIAQSALTVASTARRQLSEERAERFKLMREQFALEIESRSTKKEYEKVKEEHQKLKAENEKLKQESEELKLRNIALSQRKAEIKSHARVVLDHMADLYARLRTEHVELMRREVEVQELHDEITELEAEQENSFVFPLDRVHLPTREWRVKQRIWEIGTMYFWASDRKNDPLREVEDIDLYRCSICHELWEDGDQTTALPCKYRFCTGCIEPWLKEQREAGCPRCRQEFEVRAELKLVKKEK